MAANSREIVLDIVAENLDQKSLLLTIEARYSRVVPIDADDKTADIAEARQFLLDLPKQHTATLDAVADNSTIQVTIFADERTNQIQRDIRPGADEGAVRIVITADEQNQLRGPGAVQPVQPPTVPRDARLVAVTTVREDFTASGLSVAPIHLDPDWARLSLQNLFHTDHPVTTSVEWLGQGWPQFGEVRWTPVHLDVDGRFSPALALNGGDAWLWWLNGRRSAIGIVIDDLSAMRSQTISIALPAFGPLAEDGGDAISGAGRLRATVSESELVNNPDVYTEDPGAFCRPFNNPERILSERAFFSLFRVEQPIVSAEPTGKLEDIAHFDFELTAAPQAMQMVVGAARGMPAEWNFDNIYIQKQAVPPQYLDGLMKLNRGRSALDAAHPVQWEGDTTRYQAATVARGHLLEYRVRWRSNGYSLGTVAKTLTLAPRQVRRIQKIDWARTEMARRIESTRFTEQAADQTQRERHYDDVVQSNLSEWTRGQSSASQTGEAGGIGFALGPIVIGGGAAHSNANSSSSQEGGRSVAASEEQNLRDSVRRYGDSLRQLDSVVVTEVNQEESVTGTTEIIRNANYAHSLTVIYYQILRHLRVDTQFAGVRECLFVPFAMKPFTLQRIYRWRETLQRRMLDRRYLYGLGYLKDVLTNFSNSSIPPGARCDLPLLDLHGSIYVQLAIERPKDAADDAFDQIAWGPLMPFLGSPAVAIFSRLKALEVQARDAIFQRDYAPGIAARWADTLQLRFGNTPVAADFTLATAYRFNNTVRIDFTVDLSRTPGLTRRSLNDVRLLAGEPITPGSVANLVSMSYQYQNSTYQRTVSINKGIADLITVETGAIEPQGAHVVQVPDTWELQDLRQEITLAVQDLLQHLNEHVEYYHKVILWYMDRDRLFMLLDGFYTPGTPGVSLASLVEREPIAIVGNSLVFRVSAATFLGWGQYDTPNKLYNYYWGNQPARDPLYVSLPTDGLYAQTIMDECVALEEHKGDLDWVLDDVEPQLGDIDPSLLASRRTEPVPTTPATMPATLINLQNAPAAPDPSGLAAVLGAVTNANAFRDMAGLAGTQAGAQAALTAAAGLATNFGNQAAAVELAKLAKADQATRSANQKLASIKKAKDKDLVSEADAAAQATDALSAMNPDANGAEAPHQNPAINAAIEAAKTVPGSTVEASTPEGNVKVAMGDVQQVSLPQPTQTFCAFWDAKASPVSEADLRDAIRAAAQAERGNWFNAAGNAIKEDEASQYGHLVRYWLGPPEQHSSERTDGTAGKGDRRKCELRYAGGFRHFARRCKCRSCAGPHRPYGGNNGRGAGGTPRRGGVRGEAGACERHHSAGNGSLRLERNLRGGDAAGGGDSAGT